MKDIMDSVREALPKDVDIPKDFNIGNLVAERLIKVNEKELEELKAQRGELEAKLKELEAQKQAASEPRNIQMDEDDWLRLENILMKEKLLTREMADRRDGFQNRLAAKYMVNIATHNLSIDASTRTINITPK